MAIPGEEHHVIHTTVSKQISSPMIGRRFSAEHTPASMEKHKNKINTIVVWVSSQQHVGGGRSQPSAEPGEAEINEWQCEILWKSTGIHRWSRDTQRLSDRRPIIECKPPVTHTCTHAHSTQWHWSQPFVEVFAACAYASLPALFTWLAVHFDE